MLRNREELLDLLRSVGGQQLFYRYLIQHDLLIGATERSAQQIIGTEIWHHVSQTTGRSPDLLSTDALHAYLGQMPPLPVTNFGLPPDETSSWYEFYLGNDEYITTTIALNALIQAILLREVDLHIFHTEHCF